MGSRQDVPSSDDDDALANALTSPEATPLMSLRPISPLASNVIINDIQLLQVWKLVMLVTLLGVMVCLGVWYYHWVTKSIVCDVVG